MAERIAAEAPARARRQPDWIADLASGLDRATRVVVRLRPDGLLEVTLAGEAIGFVDYVAPVYVALSGGCPAFAVEVAQLFTLDRAVDAVRAAAEHRAG